MNRPPRASTALTRHQITPSSPLLLGHTPEPRKDKDIQYLTPRNQSHSAQGSRSQAYQQKEINKKTKTQVKMQAKIPVFSGNLKQEELKNRINKLGLESFMKDIVLKERISDPQFSSKVIHALNKTYIDNEVGFPRSQFRSSFGKKLLRESRHLLSPRVEWNPQKGKAQQQFKQLDNYIPNSMFPCRKETTRILRNKCRKQSPTCQNKPRIDPVQQLLNSQINRHGRSMNLAEAKRSNSSMSYTSSERKKNKLFFLSQPFGNFGIKVPANQRKAHQQSSLLCGKARIYV